MILTCDDVLLVEAGADPGWSAGC